MENKDTTAPQSERTLPLSGGAGGGLLLSSAYLAPVHYYTKLYSSALAQARSGGSEGIVIEEQAEHYVKQTYRNRCIIAGDDGPIALTIPVTAPAALPAPSPSTTPGEAHHPIGISKTPMHSVLISNHGEWRRQHWNAIVSAYRSSPYFEYYADDFKRVFHQPLVTHGDDGSDADPSTSSGQALQPLRLVDFNAALRDLVLDALGLHPIIQVNREHYIDPSTTAPDTDFRETIRPKIPYSTDATFCPMAYWQVFASRHGFQPNMSIIDLLFNMGPESRLILRDSIVTSAL